MAQRRGSLIGSMSGRGGLSSRTSYKLRHLSSHRPRTALPTGEMTLRPPSTNPKATGLSLAPAIMAVSRADNQGGRPSVIKAVLAELGGASASGVGG